MTRHLLNGRALAIRMAATLAAFAALTAGAAADTSQIREIQRKLYVLGRDVPAIDGRDTPAFRRDLRSFVNDSGSQARTDDEIEAALDRAIATITVEAVGPFAEPIPLDRPSFGEDVLFTAQFSPQDNLVLGGRCGNLARYRLDTGIPLKNFSGNRAVEFVYSASEKAIVCQVRWNDDINGLTLTDARSGLTKDYISVPGLEPFVSTAIAIDPTGRTVWVAGSGSVWAVDLPTRNVRPVVKGLPKSLPKTLVVSGDGTAVALTFTYIPESGKRGYPKETRIYDVASGRQISAHFDRVVVDVSAGRQAYLVENEKDDQFEAREWRSGKILSAQKFVSDEPGDEAAFDLDGSGLFFLLWEDGKGLVTHWDFRTGKVETISSFNGTGSSKAKIDAVRRQVYTVGADGLHRYSLDTGAALIAGERPRPPVLKAAAISPDGTRVAIVVNETLQILATETGQVREAAKLGCDVAKPSDTLDHATSAGFISASQLLLVCSDGGLLKVDTESGRVERIRAATKGLQGGLVTSNFGGYVALFSMSSESKDFYTIDILDAMNGRMVYRYTSNEIISTYGFADDDRRLLIGRARGLTVLDIESRKIILRQEIKLNIEKKQNRTTWYWGPLKWIAPQRSPGDATLLGFGNSLLGIVYEYRNGRLVLKHGTPEAGVGSISEIGKAGLVRQAGDGSLLVDRGSKLVTGRTDLERWTSQHAPYRGTPLALGFLKGGRFALATDAGTVLIYDHRENDPILTTVLGAEGNWLTRTKGGYFAGTRSAAENMFLSLRADETIPIDNFFDMLYRPDIVAAELGDSTAELLKESQKKAEIGTLLKEGLPPVIAITSPEGPGSVNAEAIDVTAEITPAQGGIGRIEWRINGIVRKVRTLSTDTPVRNGKVEIKDRLLLEPGANVIELTVYNAANGIASVPARVPISWGAPDQVVQPRLMVLSIGINEYWDSRLKLNFAARDAREIARSLEVAGKDLFQSVKVWLVLDEQGTRQKIAETFAEIAANLRSTDVFILFVAGHGKTEDGRYYFLPHDLKYTGTSSIAEQGIGQNDWQAWLASVAARKSLLMFDTCESGTLTLDKVTRGFDKLAALDRLTRATGRSVLAAATDTGPALEGFEGHGVFAYSVLEGLSTADPNRTGTIQVTSLASYVGARVPELSFGRFGIRQVPQMKLTGEDFAIGKTMAALPKILDDFIPSQPTHVLLATTPLLDAAGSVLPVDALPPGTLVRVVRNADTLLEVARSGKRLGFVRADALAPMQ